jgi:hypothetical protein
MHTMMMIHNIQLSQTTNSFANLQKNLREGSQRIMNGLRIFNSLQGPLDRSLHIYIYIGFHKWRHRWFIVENPFKTDYLGAPPF